MSCCGKQRKQFKNQVEANKSQSTLPPNVLDPIPPKPATPQIPLSPRELRMKNRGERIKIRLARIAARQTQAARIKARIEEANKKNQIPPSV